MPIELISPLSAVTCRERLRANTDQRSLDLFVILQTNRKPVIARFRESTIILEKRRSYRNSFASLMVLKLQPIGDRTRIHARFRMALPIYAFLIAWFGIALAFVGLFGWLWLLGLPLSRASAEPASLGALCFPVMICLAGLGIVAIGKGLAADEEDFLLAFVRQTLDIPAGEPEQST
jgi:hypothetical protein